MIGKLHGQTVRVSGLNSFEVFMKTPILLPNLVCLSHIIQTLKKMRNSHILKRICFDNYGLFLNKYVHRSRMVHFQNHYSYMKNVQDLILFAAVPFFMKFENIKFSLTVVVGLGFGVSPNHSMCIYFLAPTLDSKYSSSTTFVEVLVLLADNAQLLHHICTLYVNLYFTI